MPARNILKELIRKDHAALVDAVIDAAFRDPTQFAAVFSLVSLDRDKEWHKLARGSEKMNAIKEYRRVYGGGLLEAKNAVEAWTYSNVW